jgi:hypothetical protein
MSASDDLRQLVVERNIVLRSTVNKQGRDGDLKSIFHISLRSAQRYESQYTDTGSYAKKPRRVKSPDDWVVPLDHLNYLEAALRLEPRYFDKDMAAVLNRRFGTSYTGDQVGAGMRKHKHFTRKKLTYHAIEQDQLLRRSWRLLLSSPRLGGIYRADMLLAIDETHKDKISRLYGYAEYGEPAVKCLSSVERSQRSSISAVCSFSIEGMQTVTCVETELTAERFKEILRIDILPICNPFPAPRSVLIFDNSNVHNQLDIYALCAVYCVIALFLPPYSYEYNPIELAFKDGKQLMKSTHGLDAPYSSAYTPAFIDCLLHSTTAEVACKHFRHCGYDVSQEEIDWATSSH